ncbi:hypothetical protein PIB30_002900 [Stylosanthes scabra]|uniref:Uncharacterized protein n=1 Tax=Stylosanthes scabra TaxID=79078 RepID=A0ABU6U3D0_9FABA|nr:hypothetical protein [Stylosanthes scabra]
MEVADPRRQDAPSGCRQVVPLREVQGYQKDHIGVTLNSAWVVPLSQSKEDIEAANWDFAFTYDWFMEPLNSGTYPAVIKGMMSVYKHSNSQSHGEDVDGSPAKPAAEDPIPNAGLSGMASLEIQLRDLPAAQPGRGSWVS